jgi:hypothetical protein
MCIKTSKKGVLCETRVLNSASLMLGHGGLPGFVHSSHSLLAVALEKDAVRMLLSILQVVVDGFFGVV